MSDSDWAPFPQRSSSRSYSQPPTRSSAYPGSPRFEPAAYLFPGHQFALDGIALRAGMLGAVGAGSLVMAWEMRGGYWMLPMFAASLAFFHFMEFWITARFNTRKAEVKAFLLAANGAAYNIAHASAFTEAIIEWFFFPGLKAHRGPTVLGITLLIMGQLARSYAMAHAGTNFSHLVVSQHEQGHVLVKTGIYKYIRHPSYFGFFWWGIGTQLMLGNPVCVVAYAVVLWKFFAHRIREEERLLVGFFGDDYVQYRKQSRTLIPFIE